MYKKINGLLKQNENIKVIIKDCSLDKGLPVVGVLIIDTENQIYNFQLGSDCNPIVATERCFTELYQNTKNIIGEPFLFHREQTKWDVDRIIGYGSGQWPISIFSENTDFSFNPNSQFYSNEIENDLNNRLELIFTCTKDDYYYLKLYNGESLYIKKQD